MSGGWITRDSATPEAPRNAIATSPYERGMWDIRWDSPADLCRNEGFTAVGVNVYRSTSTERGPYFRVNALPIGSTFYRDSTTNVLREDLVDWATEWASKGQTANTGEWILTTRFEPVKADDGNVSADSPSDVEVLIDGIPVPVHAVSGFRREITIHNSAFANVATQQNEKPLIPTSTSQVLVRYYENVNKVRTQMDRKTFYRLTTVATDAQGALKESDLRRSPPISTIEVEALDWVWREAIRRNLWILQQGGERVKVFLRKQYGEACYCGMDPRTAEFSHQPSKLCLVCYGTGVKGGYDGPFDVIVGADSDAERKIEQTMFGLRLDHQYPVWTGPSPTLSQRDFLVKQNGDRYSVGAVMRPSNRGNVLQQHFTMGYLDEGDIRYQIPVTGTALPLQPKTQTTDRIVTGDPGEFRHNPSVQEHPIGPDPTHPMITDKDGIPEERQDRGRTPVWENITY